MPHIYRNFLRLLIGICCTAQVLAVPLQADGFIVHFERGGRFAASTPTVSHWVRSDVAVVRPAARRFAADAASLETEMAAWRKLPGVRLVEADVYGHFDSLADVTAPNDPQYPQQTWLGVVGARTLWALGTGRGVTVAVIDSGVDLTHPDLQANLIAGYDFGDKDAVPQDVVGHGTFVTGLLGAVGNNGVGGTGLAPGVRIMPLKTSLDKDGIYGAPLSSAIAQSIDYAVANGVDIINLSLTVDTEVELVRQSVLAALAKGVIIVAAAGNDGIKVAFPANMAGVVAVANSNTDGTLAATSNRGPEIAIAAPGVSPVSTLLGGGYGTHGSGTSYASPMAAAAVAALHAANPNLSLSALLSLLQSTATPVSGYSFGVLQAGKAAAALVPDLVPAKTQFASQDSMSVTYRLPATGTAYDIYIAVDTPLGEISLRGDGSWQAVASDGYARLVAAVPPGAAQSGLLFGSGGSYPAILLAGLPAGNYSWRIALLDSAKQSLLGTVVSSPFTVSP